MVRVTVRNGVGDVLGWFESDTAETFKGSARQAGGELLKTRGGRFVLRQPGGQAGGGDVWGYLQPLEARDWLVAGGYPDSVVAELTGLPVGCEAAPLPGQPGRPEIGKQIKVAVDSGMLGRVDRLAGVLGVSRSELIRQALGEMLERHSG